jgi:hypothetical protein
MIVFVLFQTRTSFSVRRTTRSVLIMMHFDVLFSSNRANFHICFLPNCTCKSKALSVLMRRIRVCILMYICIKLISDLILVFSLVTPFSKDYSATSHSGCKWLFNNPTAMLAVEMENGKYAPAENDGWELRNGWWGSVAPDGPGWWQISHDIRVQPHRQ